MENGLVTPREWPPPLHGLINELIDVTDIHMDNYPGMMRNDVRTHLLHISVIGSGTR